MAQQSRFLVLALCLVSAFVSVAAQAPPKTKKATPREAVDPLAEVRRATAVALVNSLADEARSFRDLTLRARAQARAADALWETDKERSRALFRRAWEAAEAADQERARQNAEERKAREAGGRSGAPTRNLPSVRPEVVRLAARRDPALGEEFFAKLEEARKQEAAAATANDAPVEQASGARFNPDDPPASITQRLQLAEELLSDGNVENALKFADPALYPVNVFGVAFLDALRKKNAAAANERYAALLTRAGLDPAADANSVSLLSSYVLTPFMYVTFHGKDSHTRRRDDNNAPPADLPTQLRTAFFHTAAAILLRPVPPPEQDRTSTGRVGTFMVITRLAPMFEQYLPDAAAALRAKLAVLQPDTPEREGRNEALTRGLAPEDQTRDRVQESLDRLSSAQTSEERDEIYLNAVLSSLRQDDPRGRELADKIEDLDLRKQVRAFLDFKRVSDAVRSKNAEETLRAARGQELTPMQRAWGITEAARLLGKAESGRAIEMLEEALAEARRIDAASPERVRALVAVATQLFDLDRARAWEVMAEVVRASNAAAEFTGEDGNIISRIQMKQGAVTTNFSVNSFDLSGIFNSLAKDDFNRAVTLAKSFTAEYPRAVATLAAAHTALDKKK